MDNKHDAADTPTEVAALHARLAETEHQLHAATARATARLASLQSVAEAFVATLTPDQAAPIVIEQAIPAVAAYGGGLVLVSDDGRTLHTIHATGYTAEIVSRWRHFTVDDSVPAALVVREHTAVWLGSRTEWAARFPENEAAQANSPSQALAALPLIVDDRVLGVLTLSFAAPQAFDAVDRAFMQTLAQQCAQAIERARLYAAERQAREQAQAQQQRLHLLSEASIVLATSLDYSTTLARVVQLVLPTLADWCWLDVVEFDRRIRRVAGAHSDPAQQPLIQSLLAYAPDDNRRNPVVAAVHDGTIQIANDVPDSMLVAAAHDAEHLRLVRALAPTAFMIVPLRVQDQLLGALTCAMAGSGRKYGADEQALAEELARRAARAIAHAQTYQRIQQEIAQRQQIEQELRWQAGLLEQSFDAIFVWEFGGPIIFWNRGAEELYGFPRREAVGQISHSLLQTSHPSGIDAFLAALAEIGHWEGELWHTTRGGRRIVVESRHVLMRHEHGRVYVLESNRDITTRKAADEQRLILERKLQEVQRMESLGMLAGGIAHDFNNLLVAMLGNAELALMDLPPESPARATITQINTAARRAADLTRQLLAYAGKGQLIVEPLDLNVLVEEMLHLLRAAIAKNVVLHFNPAPQLAPVVADATQIRQVLMNLVVNASEAIGTKSGVILITTGRMWADQAYLAETLPGVASTEGDYVFIEVSDNGAGMDMATQARLFEPFFTTKFTGRGLGLAATLGIVRGHGGTLKVYSEVGRGSTFKLLLPAAPSAEVRTPPAPHAAQDWRGSGIVLVVDDEPDVRAVVGRMIERLGFEVLKAEDGQVGLERFRAHTDAIVCVLLDMTMPHMDGTETFRRMHQARPDIPIILMSGYSAHDATVRFAGKGLAGFLQKPFRPQELATLLQHLLG